MSVKFLIAGDRAISVQFGETICMETNRQVMMLHHNLRELPHPGILETVPSYSSLMVHYHPEIIGCQTIKTLLAERISLMKEGAAIEATVTEIPVLYGGQYGMDLEDCARKENLSTKEMIRIHAGHDYYIYMLGFAPGHPYTARFVEPFICKRLATPRVKVAGGSVVIVENLSNILPFDQPCGWSIIGHTPVKLCDYQKEFPFLLKAGEWVRFIPVAEKEYQIIKRLTEQGKYQVRQYKKEISPAEA